MTGHVSIARSRVRRITELTPPLWMNRHPNPWVLSLRSEPILPIRKARKLRRAPETPGPTLAHKDDIILVLFF